MASGPGDHEVVARSGVSSYLSTLGWRPQKLMFSKTHPFLLSCPQTLSPKQETQTWSFRLMAAT